MNRSIRLAILFALLMSSVLVAAVPQLISYQGRITDSNNDPVPNGDYDITFSLYDVETGGVPFWAETLSTVGVQDGLFSIALGAITPFSGPAKNRAENDAWLGIAVGSDPELSPRTQLLSVPYAFSADRADTASFAYQSRWSDSSNYASQAQTAVNSDSSSYSNFSEWSDTAAFAWHSELSDTASYASGSGWSDTSSFAHNVADSTIGPGHLINGSVTSEAILDATIASVDIGSGAVFGNHIANNAVTSLHITNGSIQAADLSDMGATAGQILKWNDSLTSWETVDETEGAGDITAVNAGSGLTGGGTSGDVSLSIPTGGVNSTHIQDSSVANIDIATDAITSDKIAYLTITGMDIATGAISNAKILDGTIVSQDIADGQILTADIGNVQVTNEKLYPNAVTTDKIANLTITDNDISLSAAITPTKISGTAATLSGSNAFTNEVNSFDGRVGVGTSSPDTGAGLHVTSSSHFAGYFTSSYGGYLLGQGHVLHAEHLGGITLIEPIAVYGKAKTGVGPFGDRKRGIGGYFHGGRQGVVGIVDSGMTSGQSSIAGVYGSASTPNVGDTGITIGVKGIALNGSRAYALYGEADNADLNYGVFGHAEGSGDNYGVVGVVAGSGYAGYFSGPVHVTGTLSKGAGSFKIDHPLDPANKYLLHSFVESPDMMNVYNGNVELDAFGEAWIELPKWFEALNKEFRYQLTCIGGYAPVYVAEEVSDNRFRVAGGTNGMKVSWQVTGIRKDAYAEANRIPTEVDKAAEDRGMYLYPKAIGLDETMSIDYRHQPKDDPTEQ